MIKPCGLCQEIAEAIAEAAEAALTQMEQSERGRTRVTDKTVPTVYIGPAE